VTRAWFVLDPSTLLQGSPPLVVIPVENDQQAKLVTDLLSATEEDHQRVEGAILIGSLRAIQAANAITPTDRPAFDANLPDDGPAVQIVLEPTPTIRMAGEAALAQLSEQLPQIPATARNLAGTLQLMTLSLALPPEPQGRVVFNFADAGSAQQAADLLRQAVTAAREAATDPATPDGLSQRLAAALEPEVEGNTVVLSLDDAEIRNSLAKPLLLAMLQAREQARMVRSASNMRMIGGGLSITMQNDQEGRYPANFDALRGMVHVADAPENRERSLEELFTNPRTGASPGYAYVRPVERQKDLNQEQWRTLVMLYEKPPADAAADYMVNVLFPDGHVESMPLGRLEELGQQQGFKVERLPA
jgi:prepilin-type processing-associated H-X9-DG protein